MTKPKPSSSGRTDGPEAPSAAAGAADERGLPEIVTSKLEHLPTGPGCYVFRAKNGDVLYVGKAKSLRSRVRSYFQDGSSDARAFIPILLRAIGDLETIVTATEKEAAVLENSLIKERKPRYNVKLRDDKEFLTLRLTTTHEWPRLELVRKAESDGSRHFGPFHSATAARRTLHLVEKHFQLRTCSDRELVSRRRPCLQFQIKRCPAPCVYRVEPALYAEQVRAVALFLDGRHDELEGELETRMRDTSEHYEYELAAMYRDQLRAVESVRESQRVVIQSDIDHDVLGLYRQGDIVELAVLYVRAGRVVEAARFSHAHTEIPDDELVASFLREHYGEDGPGSAFVPDEVLLPLLPEGVDGVAEWLTDRRAEVARERGISATRRTLVLAPSRGPKKHLLDLAMENAQHAFEEKQRHAEDMDERLGRIQAKLRLPTLPRRIECCDISHLGGEDTVGAVVALLDGVPDKTRYRTYKVRTAGAGDDYAAMFEVLSRRFARGARAKDGEDAETWELPDLFVVDGGRGQLGVALTAAQDLGLHDLCIAGLAKERESPTGAEIVDRVYLPGQKNAIALRTNSSELYLLALARDEAHRFANKGRKKVGKRRRFASRLDDVPGIGPKTRTALLTTLGSVDGIRRAPDDAVLAVKGVSHKTLKVLRKHLGRESDDPDALEDDGVLEDTGEVDGVPENGSPEMTNVDAAENVTTEVDESTSPPTDGAGSSVGGGSG